MIYPLSLYNFGKVCKDSALAGQVLRALCRQDVDLSPEAKVIYEMIRNDNGWMDERIQAKRERERTRKAEYRKSQQMSQMSQDVPGTTRDNADETDVPHPSFRSVPPSSLPSIPPSQKNISRTDADSVRKARAATGTDRVDINPYSMSYEDLMGGKYTTMQLMVAACGKGFWAKAIRQLGDAKVLEELFTFVSEVRAGETVNNPAAVMTKRLKALGVE